MLALTKSDVSKLANQAGYRIAREYEVDPETGKPFPRRWPDDPPVVKNRIVLQHGVPSDTMRAAEYFVTSTRGVTLGRELPGGPMGERFGIVCAGDARNKTQYVLGGGKVQPDFDGTESTRLWPGEDCELVRGAMVSENYEELKIPFLPKDSWDHHQGKNHFLWGGKYFLFGLRIITDQVKSPDPRNPERMINSYPSKRDPETQLLMADACFMAITEDRLGYFEGQDGETLPRCVMPASELLRELTHQEKVDGKFNLLPASQALVLAQGILSAKEIFGENAPDALKEVIADGEDAARLLVEGSYTLRRRPSAYAKNFIKCVQETAWEV